MKEAVEKQFKVFDSMLRNVFFGFVWLLAAGTFTLSIGLPNGYGITTTLIFICSASLFYLKPQWSQLIEDDKRLFYAFLAFALSMFFSVYLDGWFVRELDRPSRFILVLPVLLLLLQSKSHQVWLWYGVVSGAIAAFVLAYYERFFLGYERASGGEYPIMFGDTAMLLGLMSFAAGAYFLSQKRHGWLVFALLAGVCGLGASVLSGSRGGWVALPLVGFFILWQSRSLLSKRTFWGTIASVAIVIFLAISIPQTGIQKKINQTIYSLSQYSEGGDRATSLGTRFEMWKAALYLFQEAPVFGAGEYGEKHLKQRLIDDGLVAPEVIHYSHAHNEFLNALSQRGIFGLAFLMLVYLVPLRLFLRKMKEHEDNWQIKSYAMAGALIPMCYMDFGLSQVMFSHNIGVMMYAFPIVYFWAATRWAEREELGESKSN